MILRHATPRRRWRLWLPLGATVLVGAVAAGIVWHQGGRSGGADPGDARQVALGQRVYATHCAACHGVDLKGQADWQSRKPDGRLPAPPHDASGHTWHHPDKALVAITRDGIAAFAPPGYESDMPPFGGALSDQEMWAVLAFIKSRWPEEIRRRQDAINTQARR